MKRRKYSLKFKRATVGLLNDTTTIEALSKKMKIPAGNITRWKRQAAQGVLQGEGYNVKAKRYKVPETDSVATGGPSQSQKDGLTFLKNAVEAIYSSIRSGKRAKLTRADLLVLMAWDELTN